jgi:excisionase family DNA binding protein
VRVAPTDTDPRAPDDPWLTVAEFAEALRVRPVTVRSWISKGDLQATRAGRRKWLIRESEIARMLDEPDDAGELHPQSGAHEPEGGDQGGSAAAFTPPAATRESANKLLGYAAESVSRAIKASKLAPPSAGYVDRLRAIADGFVHVAATLIHAGTRAGSEWGGTAVWDTEYLPYEVRPGGNRPHPRGLWDGFDAAFSELSEAMAGRDILAVGRAFRKSADELFAVADRLSKPASRRPASETELSS